VVLGHERSDTHVTDVAKPALVRYDAVTESSYADYIAEWEAAGQAIVPSAANLKGRPFHEIVAKWRADETDEPRKSGFVPSTLYFLVSTDSRILGAIHFRHELNDRLRQNGGHIGYGVRPSERRKGYATLMLGKLITLLRARNLEKVLITCDEDNPASARTIEAAGGLLEDKVPFEGKMTRRYWVRL
jgi:predicted acetyltransferase